MSALVIQLHEPIYVYLHLYERSRTVRKNSLSLLELLFPPNLICYSRRESSQKYKLNWFSDSQWFGIPSIPSPSWGRPEDETRSKLGRHKVAVLRSRHGNTDQETLTTQPKLKSTSQKQKSVSIRRIGPGQRSKSSIDPSKDSSRIPSRSSKGLRGSHE